MAPNGLGHSYITLQESQENRGGLAEGVRNSPSSTFVPEANRVLRSDRPAGPALNAARRVEGKLAFRNLPHGLTERLPLVAAPDRIKVLQEKVPEGGDASSWSCKGKAIRGTRGNPGFCHRARGEFDVHVYLRVSPVLDVRDRISPVANPLSRAILSLNLHPVR